MVVVVVVMLHPKGALVCALAVCGGKAWRNKLGAIALPRSKILRKDLLRWTIHCLIDAWIGDGSVRNGCPSLLGKL